MLNANITIIAFAAIVVVFATACVTAWISDIRFERSLRLQRR